MPLQQIFQGTICGFGTKIVLNSDGVAIFLWNPHRRRCYEAKIFYEYSGKSKEIQDIFINLDEFYVYVTEFAEDKDRVSISQDGRIKVTYQLKKIKCKTPPVVYIETEVLLTGHRLNEQKKLHNEVGDMRRQNLQCQNRIKQLTKISENNMKEIEQLKSLLEKEEPRYTQENSSDSDGEINAMSKKRKKKKYSVVSGGRNGIMEINETIKGLATDIKTLKEKVQQPDAILTKRPSNPTLSIGYIDPANEKAIFGEKMIITPDENNRYLKDEFKIQGNLITKIRAYGRFQILSNEVIPPYGRHYFVMFIEKVSFKLFSLGIVNQNRRNHKNSHESPQLISYFSKTGAIWEKGDCRSGGPQIPNGVEVRIVVDTTRYWVKWYVDRRQIASTDLGEHLKKERLVAYMEINYPGDKVYWNQRDPLIPLAL